MPERFALQLRSGLSVRDRNHYTTGKINITSESSNMASEIRLANNNNKIFETTTVEMLTAGEPLRVITSGYPEIKGDTILAKQRYVTENLDHIRKLLMREPRGHSEMYAALLVNPDHEKADLAVLFMHNGGYSVMCGHAVMAVSRYAVDYGRFSRTG